MAFRPVEEFPTEASLGLLDSIKLFSIPGWVKLAIVLILIFLGAINTTVFAFGLIFREREDFVKDSIELLSVLLPIFIITLVIWKADIGVEALRRNTEDFLTVLIPSVLKLIPEPDASFIEDRKVGLSHRQTGVRVLTNIHKGECCADILILVPNNKSFVEMLIRLEANVKKVNFCLCFDKERLEDKYHRAMGGGDQNAHEMEPAPRIPISRWLLGRFKHTAAGAGNVGAELLEHEAHGNSSPHSLGALTWHFNPHLRSRRQGESELLCLVASCHVPSDFLWDPSERLFFAQDLLFFLRSFIDEGEDLFNHIPADSVDTHISNLRGLTSTISSGTRASMRRISGKELLYIAGGIALGFVLGSAATEVWAMRAALASFLPN
jgi:hypothetical protein